MILRRWITMLDLPALPGQGVKQVELALLWARSDAEAQFRWGNAVIHRWRDLLYAQRVMPDLPVAWCVAWDGESALRLPTGELLNGPVKRTPKRPRTFIRGSPCLAQQTLPVKSNISPHSSIEPCRSVPGRNACISSAANPRGETSAVKV